MTFVICFPDFLGFCYGSDTSLKYSVALLAWYIHVAKMFFFAFDIDIDIAFKPLFRNISETLWVLNSRLIMTMPLSWVWIWCTFMFTGYLLITVTFPPPPEHVAKMWPCTASSKYSIWSPHLQLQPFCFHFGIVLPWPFTSSIGPQPAVGNVEVGPGGS